MNERSILGPYGTFYAVSYAALIDYIIRAWGASLSMCVVAACETLQARSTFRTATISSLSRPLITLGILQVKSKWWSR